MLSPIIKSKTLILRIFSSTCSNYFIISYTIIFDINTEGLLLMVQGNVNFLKGELYGFFHFRKEGHVTCCSVLAFRDVHGLKFS